MIRAEIHTKWYTDNIIRDVEYTADMILESAAIMVRDQAKEHVRPGVGPSPHGVKPHPWIDTGDLMRDIQVGDLYRVGNTLIREVGNNEATFYGSILEAGWFSQAGNFFRYPWLWPSLMIKVGDIRRMVAGIRL